MDYALLYLFFCIRFYDVLFVCSLMICILLIYVIWDLMASLGNMEAAGNFSQFALSHLWIDVCVYVMKVQSGSADWQGLWECIRTGVLVSSWRRSGCWWVPEFKTVRTWARWSHKKSADAEGKKAQREHIKDSWSDSVFHRKWGTTSCNVHK